MPIAKIMSMDEDKTLEVRDKGIGPIQDHFLLD